MTTTTKSLEQKIERIESAVKQLVRERPAECEACGRGGARRLPSGLEVVLEALAAQVCARASSPPFAG